MRCVGHGGGVLWWLELGGKKRGSDDAICDVDMDINYMRGW